MFQEAFYKQLEKEMWENSLFQAIMAQLPQEQKAKIAEQVASFQEEKSKLDAEVSKWDDSGNDIIVLAKQMCMIMMEMTDFTRWVLVCAHTTLSQHWLSWLSFSEIFCKCS